jgi:hypothetical protein
MVDVLEPYTKEIADLKKDLPNVLRKILIKRRDEVIKILKTEQLAEGIDSKGRVVGRYSPNTKNYIDPSNPPRQDKTAGQPYNFEWTGGLFDKMYLHFEDLNSFSLFSQDSKAQMLEKEYGDIFTLTDKNNERINQEILRPAMYDEIINRLFI